MMKRYWLSILLSLFCAAGIGTYYVYGANDHLPEFRLETVRGGAAEGASVYLLGNYGGRVFSQFLKINAAGADYHSRHSLVNQNILQAPSWIYSDSGIAQLLKKHRTFMRGKGGINGFYADDQQLIYAETKLERDILPSNTIEFVLDALNLASGERTRRTITVKQSMSYTGAYVADVQLVGSQVHVLTRQYLLEYSASEPSEQYRDYVFDLAGGALIRTADATPNINVTKGEQRRAYIIVDDLASAPNDYAVVEAARVIVTSAGGSGYNEETVERKFYRYAYMDGSLTPLTDFPSIGIKDLQISLKGSQLTVLETSKDTLNLARYDISALHTEESETVVTARQFGADKVERTALRNGRLYILLQAESIPMAAVIDSSGRLLYLGKVVYVGDPSQADKQFGNLHLIDIDIKS